MLSARLELGKSTVVPGEIIAYTIANEGDVDLMYGVGYRIEQYRTDTWQPVKLPKIVFPAVGLIVQHGMSRPGRMRIPETLQPGRYRVIKDIRRRPYMRRDGGEPIYIHSEFTVEIPEAAEPGDQPTVLSMT